MLAVLKISEIRNRKKFLQTSLIHATAINNLVKENSTAPQGFDVHV